MENPKEKAEFVMTLTDIERRTLIAVFDEVTRHPESEVSKNLGSITTAWMLELYQKAKMEPYCAKHGIAYEDLKEDDFENAYLEELED